VQAHDACFAAQAKSFGLQSPLAQLFSSFCLLAPIDMEMTVTGELGLKAFIAGSEEDSGLLSGGCCLSCPS